MKRGSLVRAALAAAVFTGSASGSAHAFPWSKDLRRQVSVKTQEMPRMQPTGAVTRDGRSSENIPPDPASDALVNPVPATKESLARGAAAWTTWCVACHGAGMKGDGLVVRKGMMPPPTLVGATANTMTKTDGYIYAHIRRGGPLMPPYNFALSSRDSWDLVNYIRSMQKQGGAR